MSTSTIRNRLAKLEARKKRQRVFENERSELEIARRVAYVMLSAVDGRGGEVMHAAGYRIAMTLVGRAYELQA